MKIIPVTTQDELDACLSIRRTVFIEEQNVPVELEIDELDKLESPCTHYLILDGEKAVGTFRCPDPHDSEVHIGRFCFLKDARSKHFGKAAIDFAVQTYRSQGITAIALNAQCPVIGFYEKCGFTVTSDIFDDAGIPHRSMILHI